MRIVVHAERPGTDRDLSPQLPGSAAALPDGGSSPSSLGSSRHSHRIRLTTIQHPSFVRLLLPGRDFLFSLRKVLACVAFSHFSLVLTYSACSVCTLIQCVFFFLPILSFLLAHLLPPFSAPTAYHDPRCLSKHMHSLSASRRWRDRTVCRRRTPHTHHHRQRARRCQHAFRSLCSLSLSRSLSLSLTLASPSHARSLVRSRRSRTLPHLAAITGRMRASP